VRIGMGRAGVRGIFVALLLPILVLPASRCCFQPTTPPLCTTSIKQQKQNNRPRLKADVLLLAASAAFLGVQGLLGAWSALRFAAALRVV
jgi:hypothetical protein